MCFSGCSQNLQIVNVIIRRNVAEERFEGERLKGPEQLRNLDLLIASMKPLENQTDYKTTKNLTRVHTMIDCDKGHSTKRKKKKSHWRTTSHDQRNILYIISPKFYQKSYESQTKILQRLELQRKGSLFEHGLFQFIQSVGEGLERIGLSQGDLLDEFTENTLQSPEGIGLGIGL